MWMSRYCQVFSNTTAVAPIRVAAVEACLCGMLGTRRAISGFCTGRRRCGKNGRELRRSDRFVKESEIVILLKQLSEPVKSGDAKAIAAACHRALLRLGNEESSGRLVLDALKSPRQPNRERLCCRC